MIKSRHRYSLCCRAPLFNKVAHETPKWSMSNNRGFTLIELLVVIAIISLLVSILLPSLNKAKELAKQAVCSVNLKNIGTAYALYLNEYDEKFFESTANNGNNYWVQGPQAGVLLNLAGVDVPVVDQPRFSPETVFDCPAQESRPPYAPDTEATNWWNFSAFRHLDYAYCAELGDWGGFKASGIIDPSQVVVFYDSTAFRGYSFSYGVEYWNEPAPWGWEPWVKWHHPGARINLLFVDGHVEPGTEDEILDEWFHPAG